MSQTTHLSKQKIERLELFLKNNDIEKCCSKFKINSSSLRESISNTVKSLHELYIKSNEHYIGSFKSITDINFNNELIHELIERHKKRIKPNVNVTKDEIIDGIKKEYDTEISSEINILIEGALWVLKNYKITKK